MQDWQERIEERLKRVEEQQNKPPIILVEHHYPDIEQLKEIIERNQHEMRQELHTHSESWLDALQQNFDENRADIANIKATQSDQSEKLQALSATQMAMKESQADIRDTVVRLEKTMATKQDIAQVNENISTVKNEILAAIKQMLQDNKG